MHGKKKPLALRHSILTDKNLWWLIGYLQGDGSVDRRNGIWLISTDHDLIDNAERIIRKLFGLNSSFYIERRKFPWKHKPKLKLAVYSRNPLGWLDGLGLRFGEKQWNVPPLPRDLFHSYLAGLFDAEGQVLLRRNANGQAKVAMIIIHSINAYSLNILARKVRREGVKCVLLRRVRRNRPNPHYELRISRRFGLKWFKKNVSRHSRLARKKMLLDEKYLPTPTISGTRV